MAFDRDTLQRWWFLDVFGRNARIPGSLSGDNELPAHSKVWSTVRASLRVMSAANRHLRGLVFGGLVHPQFVIGTRLVGLLFRLKNRGLTWNPRPPKGTILHKVRPISRFPTVGLLVSARGFGPPALYKRWLI